MAASTDGAGWTVETVDLWLTDRQRGERRVSSEPLSGRRQLLAQRYGYVSAWCAGPGRRSRARCRRGADGRHAALVSAPPGRAESTARHAQRSLAAVVKLSPGCHAAPRSAPEAPGCAARDVVIAEAECLPLMACRDTSKCCSRVRRPASGGGWLAEQSPARCGPPAGPSLLQMAACTRRRRSRRISAVERLPGR